MNKKLKFSITLITLLLISCAGDVSSQTSFESSSSSTFTVAFDSRGGSIIPNQIVEPNSFISPPNVSKEGHNLEGWYTSLNDGVTLENRWNFLEDRVNFDFTLYASWITNQYTISFESNGDNTINSITDYYGANLTTPSPTKIGHSFSGWYTDVGLTQSFTLTTMPAQNITLFGTWTINQYTITFETNGGSNIASITGNYGDSISVPNDPTREGYTFNGWYADFTLTQSTTVPNAIPAQNITLFATWTINQYTITFETNGGSSIASITGNYGDAVSVPNDPTREGYTFNGWYADFTLTQSTTVPNAIPAENLTLYTKWNEIFTIKVISMGAEHSSALTPAGRVYMWGSNHRGQLGVVDDYTTNKIIPTEITSRFSLVADDKIIGLSLGANHSSAISSTGRVYMWGYNHIGQLGDGTTTDRYAPTEITSRFSLAEGDKITYLSLGTDNSSAISSTGRVYMWGNDSFGQLGIGVGGYSYRNVPIEITSAFYLTAGDKIIGLSLGAAHSSAISSTGRVYMWGYNAYGQLGDGTYTNVTWITEITSRFSLAADDKIIGLSIGAFSSSALSSTGRVFMWGANNIGQLGDETYTNRNVPAEITSRFSLAADDKIIGLSLGPEHSSAISSTGRVFVWGANTYQKGNETHYGLLGDGTYRERNVPTEITSRFPLDGDGKIIRLSLGASHSSAISSTGRVYMWGNNYYGQLGNGFTHGFGIPVLIFKNAIFD